MNTTLADFHRREIIRLKGQVAACHKRIEQQKSMIKLLMDMRMPEEEVGMPDEYEFPEEDGPPRHKRTRSSKD